MLNDLRIGVIAYNFPHKKTNEFLVQLKTDGIPVNLVIAADPVQLNIHPGTIRTKVRHHVTTHPKQLADTFGIPYVVCTHNSDETVALINEHRLDIGIIAGARILPEKVINAFRKGVINFHPGLLPEVRGLDALLWSIEKGIPLGITAHLIDRKVDAGQLVLKQQIPVYADDNIFDLSERLYEYQLIMIRESIERVANNRVEPLVITGGYNRKMPAEMEQRVLAKLPEYIKKHSGSMENPPSYFAHPTAVIDDGCVIGSGVKIWHFSHVMKGATIGEKCNIGQNVVVSPQVIMGKNVRVQNNVSLYEGVICEDDVFLGPSMVFTNIINPRSAVSRKDEFRKTLVRKGASIGANATIVCGNEIGSFAFVGAGAVVTKPVPPYALVVGNPARQVGWMSEYGHRLHFNAQNLAACPETGEQYQLVDKAVKKIS